MVAQRAAEFGVAASDASSRVQRVRQTSGQMQRVQNVPDCGPTLSVPSLLQLRHVSELLLHSADGEEPQADASDAGVLHAGRRVDIIINTKKDAIAYIWTAKV